MAGIMTSGPFVGLNCVPKDYEILVEFPVLYHGWECDPWAWILADSDANLCVGHTNHGSFYIVEDGPEFLQNKIALYQQHASFTQRAYGLLRGHPPKTRGEEKEEYYEWVKENDNYPEHSHLYIVIFYAGDVNSLYRTFGPFTSAEEARTWEKNYRSRYTKHGFIRRCEVVPMCSVVGPDYEPTRIP